MKHFINSTFYELKQAYLSLKQKPLFVFSVVSTMGITLGALLCVLTLAYVMLIKPLPYPEQDKLYSVEHQLVDNNDKIDGRAFTYPNLMHLYNHQTVFEQSALMYLDADILTSSPAEPMVVISYVTPEWFSLFNISMALGRSFEKTEAVNSYNPVALLNYDTWQQEFNGDSNVINQSIEFGGRRYKIIGVLSKDNTISSLFDTDNPPQLFIPWDFNSISESERKKWGNDDGGLTFLGKIKSQYSNNSSTKIINQTLTQIVNNNWQEKVSNHAFFKDWKIALKAKKLKEKVIGDSKYSLYFLIAGALGLALIACTNIANLFISRTAERQQQLAIQAAIGASSKRLFQTILSEIALVMLSAIAIAQVVTFVGFSILQHNLSNYFSRVDELGLNTFSITISLLLLIILTLLFALLCRRMINYKKLSSQLESSGKGSGIQVSVKTRNILIASQIFVASTLMFINILFYQDAQKMIEQPLGYQTDNIFSAVLGLPSTERNIQKQVLTDLKKVLAQQPEITGVSQAMRPSAFATLALITEENNQRYSVLGKDIDHQYFPLINQPLIAGDNFSKSDIQDQKPVMVINDIFAKQLAPNGSAIGFKFKNGARVIGVVKSINVPGRNASQARFYFPARLSRNMLLIKVKSGQSFNRDQMLATLKQVNKKLTLFSFNSLTSYKKQRLFSAMITAKSTLVLIILTLFLSAIGLYGILSYSTQMRRFEIGTRMAIGAKRSDLIKLIIQDNARAILLGMGISVLLISALALGFSEQLQSYLTWQLIPLFLITLGLVSLISFAACYLPLRQYINKPAVYSLRGSE